MQLIETEELVVLNWHEADTSGDLQTQIASVLDALEKALRAYNVPFSAMLKHTIAIRNGAVDPLAAIAGFHRHCHALAPPLRQEPGVGTIFRVPRFAGDKTLVAVEAVFAKYPQGVRRVLFEDMPMDVARALEYRGQIFLTGFEALELLQPELGFAQGNEQVRESLAGQIDVVLDKIDLSLKGLDANCSMLNRLSLYLRADQEPAQVQQWVRAAAEKRAGKPLPDDFHLFMLRGHGMVLDSFKIEIDGLALRPDAKRPGWVSLCCGQGHHVSEAAAIAAATALAARLSPQLKHAPRALQVVLKHTDSTVSSRVVDALSGAFSAQLNQRLGAYAPEQLSVALLHVNALLESDAAIELDASVFIS